MKNVGRVEKNFDLDISDGRDGESHVLSMLDGAKKIEVKTDRLAHITGNVSIEYMYKGRPSGISTTEADYWAFVIRETNVVIFCSVDRLKKLCREYYKVNGSVKGGDYHESLLINLPLPILIKKT